MKNQSTLNIEVKNFHRTKQEIYNQFSENKPNDSALWKATQDNHKSLQTNRLRSPLYQTTNIMNNDREVEFKSTSKKTTLSDQKSMIFDFGNERATKETQFKSCLVKVQEPGNKSDQQYKQQLKTSEYPNRSQLYRNPISDGDPKSQYSKKMKTKYVPINQIHLG